MTKKELVDMLAEYPLETEIEFTRLVLDPDGDYVDQVIDIEVISPETHKNGIQLDKITKVSIQMENIEMNELGRLEILK
jgi:hypothetical protein